MALDAKRTVDLHPLAVLCHSVARQAERCRLDTMVAWLGITGLFVMLFTYLGVSLLMKSSHSF